MFICILIACSFGMTEARNADYDAQRSRIFEGFRYSFIWSAPGDFGARYEPIFDMLVRNTGWDRFRFNQGKVSWISSTESGKKHWKESLTRRRQMIASDRTIVTRERGTKMQTWDGTSPAFIVDPLIWRFDLVEDANRRGRQSILDYLLEPVPHPGLASGCGFVYSFIDTPPAGERNKSSERNERNRLENSCGLTRRRLAHLTDLSNTDGCGISFDPGSFEAVRPKYTPLTPNPVIEAQLPATHLPGYLDLSPPPPPPGFPRK